MRYIFIPIILFLSACNSLPSARNGGGTDFLNNETITTKYDPEGNITEKIETNITNIQVKQPQNPKEGGALIINKKPNGDIRIGADTSGTLDTDAAIAAIAGLNPVTYTGIFLILAGVGIGILTKGRQLLPAAGLSGTGIFLIALAFLIPTYKSVFMIGIIVTILAILGYIFYIARKYFKTEVALEETIDTVDAIKPSLDQETKYEIFKANDAEIKQIQSLSTRKIIDKKRNKKKYG